MCTLRLIPGLFLYLGYIIGKQSFGRHKWRVSVWGVHLSNPLCMHPAASTEQLPLAASAPPLHSTPSKQTRFLGPSIILLLASPPDSYSSVISHSSPSSSAFYQASEQLVSLLTRIPVLDILFGQNYRGLCFAEWVFTVRQATQVKPLGWHEDQ